MGSIGGLGSIMKPVGDTMQKAAKADKLKSVKLKIKMKPGKNGKGNPKDAA